MFEYDAILELIFKINCFFMTTQKQPLLTNANKKRNVYKKLNLYLNKNKIL